MIVADTSVWVAALRSAESAETAALGRLLDEDRIALAAPIRLELLLGAANREVQRLRRILVSARNVRGFEGEPMDWDSDPNVKRPVAVGDLVELQRRGAWAAVQVINQPDTRVARYTGVIRATGGLPATIRPGAFVSFEGQHVVARIGAG